MTLKTESGSEFKVNGQRLKHYFGGNIDEDLSKFEERGEFLLKGKHFAANI